MGNYPDLDYHALAGPLDLVTWDSYPTGYAEVQSESLYPLDEARSHLPYSYDVGDPAITGFCHDLTRGLKRAPFWVMEQQCGNINWTMFNTGVRSGAVRLWTWHALASGASAVVYFRWRAGLYAQEQHHSGLLHHDSSPATGYEDLVKMRAELELMAQVAAEPIRAQVALLSSYQDLWALELQPHRRGFEYQRHLFVYYLALQRLGITTDIVSPEADLSAYKIVIAPTAFLADERLAGSLMDFASTGGTVLLGVRSGFKTPSNRVTDRPLPGVLSKLIGARLTGWHALPPGIEYDVESQIPGLGGSASFWMEGLHPLLSLAEEREVGGGALENERHNTLVRYTGGPFASQAALIENRVGEGHALYLGWYPTYNQTVALVSFLVDQAGIHRHRELPPGVVVAQRGAYTILLNFTDTDFTTRVDGRPVTVGPRDVSVVLQRSE
jgi:beta-galactosidase